MGIDTTKPRHRLPGIEFEGPLGFFWDSTEVPIEAIADAIFELFEEATKRGFNEHFILELAKQRKVMKGESRNVRETET